MVCSFEMRSPLLSGALDPAKAQSGLTEKRKALSASLPERASEEPSGLGRRQGTNELIQNEPADAKQHPMGSAISRLGRKISQVRNASALHSFDGIKLACQGCSVGLSKLLRGDTLHFAEPCMHCLFEGDFVGFSNS